MASDTTSAAGLPGPGEPDEIRDKRLLRGARTREAVLRYAVDIASLDGLDQVSFGQLAADTGLSKSGIQTLFRSKETLQLAVIGYARQMFRDAVIGPAQSASPGVARLRALLGRWREYATAPLFAGGCFWVANRAYFDSKPGVVRDELMRDQQAWLDVIAGELASAVAAGEIAGLDVKLAAFEIDALLAAANTALRVGDDQAMDKVWRIVEAQLTPLGA
jgi:AcrR family transcriptional regulator